MSRKTLTIVAIAVIIIGIVAAAALAYAFLRPTEEASGPIEALSISGDAEPTDEEALEPEPAGSRPILFEISQSESQARFILGEVLRGEPNSLVGSTDQVAAEILFDPADPEATQVGTILVNARTLATDDNRRNRAMGNQILYTDRFEFISFSPTSISGLPDAVTFGDSVILQITGDLTIRGLTNVATFEVVVIPVSAERLEGRASTTVMRGDYGLTIPNVPFVANVDEEVLLELDFVALPVG